MSHPLPLSFRVYALAKYGNLRKSTVQASIPALAASMASNSSASLLNTVNVSKETGVYVHELDVRLASRHSTISL